MYVPDVEKGREGKQDGSGELGKKGTITVFLRFFCLGDI